MRQTLGQMMVNDLFPEEHRGTEQLVKKVLDKKLVAMAKKDPKAYVGIITGLKRVGDEVVTLEGASVGLDDLMPVYDVRNKIMHPAVDAVKHAKTDADREKIILDTQAKILKHTAEHPGSMTQMAASG